MKPYLFLLFSLCTSGLSIAQHQQWFKTKPPVTEDMPVWAQLMYAENPNLRRVDSAYQAYYRTHAFEKTAHTQNYRHWRRPVEPFLDAEGYVQWPTPAEQRADEQRYLRLLEQHPEQRQPGPWEPIGPFETLNQGQGQFEVSWQVNVYTIDQSDTDPHVLYCGTESGGVYKSTDSGQHWIHASSNTMMSNVRIVRISPQNAAVVYAGDGNRVYRTTDGGANWEAVLDAADLGLSGLGINAIAISPAEEGRVIAGGQQGLWYTNDGGLNWQQLSGQPVYDIEFKPGDPATVYLVRGNTTGKRCEFLKSIDGGLSWEVKSEGWYLPSDPSYNGLSDGGAKIAVSALNPELVLAGLLGNSKPGDDGYLGLWRSTDAGENWSLLGPHVGGPYEYSGGPANHKNVMKNEGGGGPYQGFYDYVLGISPFDANTVYIGGVSLYKSVNGGAAFNVIGGYQGNTWIHPDMQELAIGPDGIWLATDGGVDFTNDEFATVESRKRGITASEFWGFSSAWNENLVVGGRYHNGNTAIRPSFGAGQSLRLGGGEAPTGYLNPGGRGVAYFSDISSQVIPEELSGAVLGLPQLQYYPSESYFAAHSSELEFAPHCYNHIYIGQGHRLWKSENGGQSFTLVKAFGADPDRPLLHFEISRSNPRVMYVYQRTSFYGATLHHTDDGGQSWQQRPFPSGIGSQRAGVLALNPENENELWVAFAHQNNDGAKVFRTLDGGGSWENQTTALLDGHRAQAIFYQGGTDGSVYLGTDKAVFYRDNSTGGWQFYNEGLPLRTQSNIFRPYYREGKLRMGTYSHGAWEVPFAVSSLPLAQPTVDKLSSGCLRDTFYFDDYSILSHQGASWQWSFSPEPDYVSAHNVRNPKVVFGTEGHYSVTLAITNEIGQSSTRALQGGISVQACQVDTIPGLALHLQNTGDYASIEGLPINGNELTITAWVRPEGVQPDYTGIVMSSGGPAAGFNFRPGMELGYHWPGGAWWWSSGLTVPVDEWSYVAMVVRPDGITLYLNGRSATHQFPVQAVDFRGVASLLGRYRDWDSRNFKGLIDEVRIYGRALETSEIRLLRHLTSRPEQEPELLAYFQFNEPEGLALNKLEGAHAVLAGNAGRTLSTVPVGSGVSVMQLLDQQGAFTFDGTGLSLSMGGGAVVPNGPVVVSRLNVPPDAAPGQDVLPPGGYWIINSYGLNTNWGPLQGLSLGGVPIPAAAAEQPDIFSLHHRPENADGDTWSPALSQAVTALPGETEGILGFGPDNSLPGAGQLLLRQGELVGTQQPLLPQASVAYPNPLLRGEPLKIALRDPGEYAITICDSSGKVAWKGHRRGPLVTLDGLSLAAGVYTCYIASEAYMAACRLVVVEGKD
ncbi:MAG: hypothetical protein KDD19_13345 [Phaeodactylibacter sp.]|nr:hypothetical protein [Phaeodactylibacter sp.]MCB9049443.1 hypothetical protein [Lewinellaceae bacterium]